MTENVTFQQENYLLLLPFLFTFCIFRPSSLLRSSMTGLLSPIHEPSDFDEYMEDIGKNKNMLCSIIFII